MTALADLRSVMRNHPRSVQVVFGIHTVKALLDFDGQPWGDDGAAQVGGEVISLTYVFPDLPGLAPGSSLTAGAVAYVVSAGPRRRGDGLEAVVLLEEA